MLSHIPRQIWLMLVTLSTAVALIACGGNTAPATTDVPVATAAQETECIDIPNEQDQDTLRQYAAQNGDSIDEAASSDDTLCVIKHLPDGSVQQQYVTRSDVGNGGINGADFAIGMYLASQGHGLLGAAVVSDTIDPATALILSSINTVDRDGYVNRGFERDPDGRSFHRNTKHTTTIRTTNTIIYGSTPQPRDKPAPAKYHSTPAPKADPDETADFAKDPKTGKTQVVAKNKKTGKTNVIKPTRAPAVGKNVATAPNNPNPNVGAKPTSKRTVPTVAPTPTKRPTVVTAPKRCPAGTTGTPPSCKRPVTKKTN